MPSMLCNLQVPHGVNKVAAYAVCQLYPMESCRYVHQYDFHFYKKSLTLANFETTCICFNVEFAIELY